MTEQDLDRTINPDAMDDDDLTHLVALGRYAAQTLRARDHRAAGRIEQALAYEREAELIYKELPQERKW